jgi:hypothetical protein
MSFGKPKLKDGVLPFLTATENHNNGFTAARFIEIMGYNIPRTNKISIISREAQVALNTVKRWVSNWEDEAR